VGLRAISFLAQTDAAGLWHKSVPQKRKIQKTRPERKGATGGSPHGRATPTTSVLSEASEHHWCIMGGLHLLHPNRHERVAERNGQTFVYDEGGKGIDRPEAGLVKGKKG